MKFRVSVYMKDKAEADEYLRRFFGDPPVLGAEVIRYNGQWVVVREATEEELSGDDVDFLNYIKRGKIYKSKCR